MPRIVKCGCGQEVGVGDADLGSEGRCVWCGDPLRIADENSRRVPALGVTTPKMETDALPELWETSSATQCCRCMQPFRGDWDRYITDSGVLCHRCKNLWRPPQSNEPQIAPSPSVRDATMEFNPLPLLTEGARSMADPFVDALGDRLQRQHAATREAWWERHRAKFYFGAFAVIVVGILTILPLDRLMVFVFTNEAAREGRPLSAAAGFLFLVLRGSGAVLNIFVPLYAGLHAVDALPNDTLRNNLIAVGAVSALLALLSLLDLVTGIPFWWALAFIVQVAIILYLYDLGSRDLGKFLLVFIVVASVTHWVTLLMLGGTYGLLAGWSA